MCAISLGTDREVVCGRIEHLEGVFEGKEKGATHHQQQHLKKDSILLETFRRGGLCPLWQGPE